MRASVLFLFVMGSSTACGLSVTGSSDMRADGGSSPAGDGGTSPGDGSDPQSDGAAPADGGMLDASADASADGPPVTEGGDGCTLLIDDTFTTQSPSWDLLSSASFSAGHVELTPNDDGGHAGAIWWKAPLTFSGVLRAEVDFMVDSSDVTAGHGLAIAWVAATAPYAIGEQGQNFGICNSGLAGVAVAADSRDEHLLAMDSVSGTCGTNNGVWTTTVGGGGTLKMELRSSSLTAILGGTTGTRAVSVPKTGYFGITASTGGGSESSHVVAAVRVRSCL